MQKTPGSVEQVSGKVASIIVSYGCSRWRRETGDGDGGGFQEWGIMMKNGGYYVAAAVFTPGSFLVAAFFSYGILFDNR
ncbi:MAG TPA: hypothetical protein IGS52_20490 [Oscillatoriaceae cyanobacterium M33_DOE_052]|uniref:Uncharacterized protein n=1 Tax=Planktothricoides sp. SpSt-374 TaxID=2282167 RepID=A0A7C3ZH62_9CYAN|nr:hypothetical protein [Oscillatoriaceae cyanobacterium M33_DOE_052]